MCGAMPFGFGRMGYGMMGTGFGSIALWVLILGGLAVLVYLLVRTGPASGRGADMEDAAMEVLRKRYARGEIIKDEFEEMRRTLAQRRAS